MKSIWTWRNVWRNISLQYYFSAFPYCMPEKFPTLQNSNHGVFKRQSPLTVKKKPVHLKNTWKPVQAENLQNATSETHFLSPSRPAWNESKPLKSPFSITFTDAINIFIKQSLRTRGIPFQITMDTPDAVMLAAMEEARLSAKDSNAKTYANVEDALAGLKKWIMPLFGPVDSKKITNFWWSKEQTCLCLTMWSDC